MANISLKKDFQDGQILYGSDLNANNDVIEKGVNDNYSLILELDKNKPDNTDLNVKLQEIDSKLNDKANINDVNAQLDKKVTKEEGKGLSSNDFTKAEKDKLAQLSNYDDSTIKQELASKANISDIPTKVSSLENDAHYTDETYVNELVKSIKHFKAEIVSELPEIGEENVLYLVPKSQSEEENIYDEFMWINGTFESIGATSVNLQDYYNKQQSDELFLKDIAIKQDNLDIGNVKAINFLGNAFNVSAESGTLNLASTLSEDNFMTKSEYVNNETNKIKEAEKIVGVDESEASTYYGKDSDGFTGFHKIPSIKEPYELPVATTNTLGGVKIGQGINVAQDGTISAESGTSYQLPIASAVTLGGIKVGEGLEIDSETGILKTVMDASLKGFKYFEGSQESPVNLNELKEPGIYVINGRGNYQYNIDGQVSTATVNGNYIIFTLPSPVKTDQVIQILFISEEDVSNSTSGILKIKSRTINSNIGVTPTLPFSDIFFPAITTTSSPTITKNKIGYITNTYLKYVLGNNILLSSLKTSDKTSIIAAVNELFDSLPKTSLDGNTTPVDLTQQSSGIYLLGGTGTINDVTVGKALSSTLVIKTSNSSSGLSNSFYVTINDNIISCYTEVGSSKNASKDLYDLLTLEPGLPIKRGFLGNDVVLSNLEPGSYIVTGRYMLNSSASPYDLGDRKMVVTIEDDSYTPNEGVLTYVRKISYTDMQSDNSTPHFVSVAIINKQDNSVIETYSLDLKYMTSNYLQTLQKMYDEALETTSKYVSEAINELNRRKLTRIWQNSNPTSEFAAQDLSFDLANYEYLIIKSQRFPSVDNSMIYTRAFINESTEINYSDYEASLTTNRSWNRKITVSTSGISFQNATISGSVDNNALVPYEIWGMPK